MFIVLSKVLPLFVYPLGLACVLVTLALLLRRHDRWQAAILVLAFSLLWLGGNRWVAYGLVLSLEGRHPPLLEAPAVDAIVVLGGGTRSPGFPRLGPELNEAGDRVIYAAWLYRQGRADHVLVTGGTIDWLGPGDPGAANMAWLLDFLGVPEEAVWLEPDARNTYENALYSRAILEEAGLRRILLVTSAMHMPRSVLLFQRQGLEVIPAPTDFLITQADWQYLRQAGLPAQLFNLLPNAEFLDWTTRALREYIGIAIYRLRGWL